MAGGKSAGRAIAVVLVLLALAGVGFAVALAMGSQRSADAKVIGVAESHFALAMEQAKTISESVEDATGDDVTETASTAKLDQASDAVEAGRAEIEAARAAIRQLDASEGRTLYMKSLDSAEEAFEALADLVDYARTTTGVYARMNAAADLASTANKQLNDAVSAGNKGDYSAMNTTGEAARTSFLKAAKLFDEAQALDPSSELKYSAQYARLRQEQAELVMRMAADGKAGRLSAYNDAVAKLQKLDAKAEDVPQPAIVADPTLTARRIDALNAAITSAAARADRQHAEALAVFDATK